MKRFSAGFPDENIAPLPVFRILLRRKTVSEVVSIMKNLLDKTDLEILAILEENARTPIKSIAQRVFISPPTVAARIDAMEKAGIILGYHAKISDSILGHPVRAFINLEVTPGQEKRALPVSRGMSRCDRVQPRNRGVFRADADRFRQHGQPRPLHQPTPKLRQNQNADRIFHIVEHRGFRLSKEDEKKAEPEQPI